MSNRTIIEAELLHGVNYEEAEIFAFTPTTLNRMLDKAREEGWAKGESSAYEFPRGEGG